MTTSLKFLAVPLAVGALFFAGCGGDDDSSSDTAATDTTEQTQPANNDTSANGSENQGAAQVLALAADPSGALKYDLTELSAEAGTVQIDLANDSPVPHDVVVRDAAGDDIAKSEVVTSANTSTEEFEVEPGEYTFYCSVPGHEAGGMVGTLTVE